jgi:hypothetical protein
MVAEERRLVRFGNLFPGFGNLFPDGFNLVDEPLRNISSPLSSTTVCHGAPLDYNTAADNDRNSIVAQLECTRKPKVRHRKW